LVQVERDEDEDGFVASIARRRPHLEAATTFRQISHVDFCRLKKIREALRAMAAALAQQLRRAERRRSEGASCSKV